MGAPSMDAATAIEIISHETGAIMDLLPLDSEEVVLEALPHWRNLYGVFASTTFDQDTEDELLRNSRCRALAEDIRIVLAACEVAFETTWARRVASRSDPLEARAELDSFPCNYFYEHMVRVELNATEICLGRYPRRIAVLGSGALPLTSLWIVDKANTICRDVKVHNVEVHDDRLELSQQCHSALGGYERISFESGDAAKAPVNLEDYDAVYFNGAVGASEQEREALMLSVVQRMRHDAVVITRTSSALETMMVPAPNLKSRTLLGNMQPALTCHLHDGAGKFHNTSVVISRVVRDDQMLDDERLSRL